MSTDHTTPSTPLVTVAMPVRNGEAFIREAIASVLQQSFRELVLFISDNASTDQTASIVRAFAQSDPRIEYHRQKENIGLGGNLAFCLQSARTRYVTFLPHDDLLDSRMALERAVEMLERDNELAAVFSHMRYIDERSRTITCRRFRTTGYLDSDDLVKQSLITTRNQFGIPVLMRTELLHAYTIDPTLNYVGDVDFCYACARGRKVYRVPEVLIANRFHTSNATSSLIKDARAQFLRLAEKHDIRLTSWEWLLHRVFHVVVYAQKRVFLFIVKARSRLENRLRFGNVDEEKEAP